MILTVEPGRGGGGGGGGVICLGTILTVEPGRGGGGHLSLETMILTVEPGEVEGGGGGAFVSRNNDSNCRTRERGWWAGGWSYLSLGTIPTVEPGRGGLSLGTMILTVESGRVVARNKILGVDRGRAFHYIMCEDHQSHILNSQGI